MKAGRSVLSDLPRLALVPEPTPLTHVPRLAAAFGGPALWMKRDDLIPFGLGGNKVRGLELIVAHALVTGADTLVTGAGPLSNHVRATAAAASHAGLSMVACYWGNPPARIEGNHRLSLLFGAEIRFTGSLDRSSVDCALEIEATRIREVGRNPYVIPRGGACTLGVIGHVRAVEETMAQCEAAAFMPERIMMAVGSGGTLAGWLLGSQLLGAPWRIEAVTVSRPAHEARERVALLIKETADKLGITSKIDVGEIIIHDGFVGAGYGTPSAEGEAALTLVARTEGILLDPIYTAKALAGYRALVAQGHFRNVEKVLFLHTGGLPSLFVE